METLLDQLEHVIATNHLAQAYIIVGPVYDEGQTLAAWFGRKLLGDLPTIATHTHPDMPWFEPEKKSRIIDVEMMSERILPFALQSSLCGGWKVPVIISADRMNEKAANAFLKTLEEPPGKTLFLLLVESLSDMLPTIISRCQVLYAGGARSLPEPWRGSFLRLLAGVQDKSLMSSVCMGEAICGLLSEMDDRAKEEVVAEAKANTALSEDDDQLNAKISARSKKWRADLFYMLEQWMEDLVRCSQVASSNGTAPALHFEDYIVDLKERASHYSLAKLLENQEMLDSFVMQVERNIPPSQILPYWMDRFYL